MPSSPQPPPSSHDTQFPDPEPYLPPARTGLALSAALSTHGQLALLMLMPSLPALARELDASAAAVQLTYVMYLAAFAAALPVWGVVLERHGRRSTLFSGLAIAGGGCVLGAHAASLETLLIARALQAFGTSCSLIVARATMRDDFKGDRLARRLFLSGTALGGVSATIPLIGGLVHETLGWRAGFSLTFLVTAALGAWSLSALPNAPATARASSPWRVACAALLRDRAYRTLVLATGAVHAAHAAFVVGSPAILVVHLGLEPIASALHVTGAGAGYVLGGVLAERGVAGTTPRTKALVGLLLIVAGATTQLTLVLVSGMDLGVLATSTALFAMGQGIFMPTSTAAALERADAHPGLGVAVQGFVQMGLGGALGALAVGAVQSASTVLAVPIVVAGGAGVAIALFVANLAHWRNTLGER